MEKLRSKKPFAPLNPGTRNVVSNYGNELFCCEHLKIMVSWQKIADYIG